MGNCDMQMSHAPARTSSAEQFYRVPFSRHLAGGPFRGRAAGIHLWNSSICQERSDRAIYCNISGRLAFLLSRPCLLRHWISLDLPAPSTDALPATSSDLKLSPSASTFRDPVIHIPRPHPTFPIPSSTFIVFTPSSFCFLDLSICPTLSTHFSTMIDPPRALPMHSSMLIDIVRSHSAFRSPTFLDNSLSTESVSLNSQLTF
jgi:hypothetical protein